MCRYRSIIRCLTYCLFYRLVSECSFDSIEYIKNLRKPDVDIWFLF